MTALLLAQTAKRFWMPEGVSTVSRSVDGAFYFIYYVSLFFFLLIAGLMFWFMWKYRQRRPGEAAIGRTTHHRTLELVWSVLPAFLLVAMFWWGFQVFMHMRVVPANTLDINVLARRWNWQFVYPNGQDHDELHVPVDTRVRLVMRSEDVIHSAFIPAFRVKRDVVPGRYSELWFEANKPGEYPLLCAEYCGTSHSDMRALVVVHPTSPTEALPQTYDQWLETANPIMALTEELYPEYVADPQAFIDKYKDDPKWGKIVSKLQKSPVVMGEQLYKKKGCVQCHTVDGKRGSGPTWFELYNSKVALRDGSTVTADENYIRESILEPGKRIVAGYDNLMSKIKVSDREIDMIIAYIKSLQPQGQSGQ